MKALLGVLALLATSPLQALGAPLPSDCRQVVCVQTSDWTTSTGHLSYFDKDRRGQWHKVDGWRVRIGRKGLAWGEELPIRGLPAGQRKKEGDGKSPAGTFPLLDGFGQASESNWFPNFPFQAMSADWQGVDDVKSRYYNQLVNVKSIGTPKDWNSAENMCISEYVLGLRVGYNTDRPVKGNGSCIFVHVLSVPERATSGCTAMELDQLHQLSQWLRKTDRPYFVSLPTAEYSQLRNRWGLP